MEILKLSNVIGQEIAELKFHYVQENEYGLQTFDSFIKLANGKLIGIPKFDDDDYLELNPEVLEYYTTKFNTGSFLNNTAWRNLIIGQKIEDFLFCYYDNEIDFEFSAYIKLSNGYYITETNSGPVGITDVDLQVLNEKEFQQEMNRLKNNEIEVRSFLKTKNIC
ncbi:hypothetical protein [Flavobacterium pedocola]